MTRRPVLFMIIPLVLGLVAAGTFAFALGWVDAALAALGVGVIVSTVVAVLVALHAVALALVLLYRAVAVLWRVVQDMGTWLDLDDDECGGGGGGGVRDDHEAEPEVLYADRTHRPIGWTSRK